MACRCEHYELEPISFLKSKLLEKHKYANVLIAVRQWVYAFLDIFSCLLVAYNLIYFAVSDHVWFTSHIEQFTSSRKPQSLSGSFVLRLVEREVPLPDLTYYFVPV